MTRIMAGGREIDVPTNPDGRVDVATLREAVGAAPDRALIRQSSGGENHVLPTKGATEVHPYDHFMDAPRARRG